MNANPWNSLDCVRSRKRPNADVEAGQRAVTVAHLANATGGVESGNWFAMEFTSPDRTKGWATVIRLPGGQLMREGLRIQPPANPRSELIPLEQVSSSESSEKKP